MKTTTGQEGKRGKRGGTSAEGYKSKKGKGNGKEAQRSRLSCLSTTASELPPPYVDVRLFPSFWRIIQKGLLSIVLGRKRALYLLRRAVTSTGVLGTAAALDTLGQFEAYCTEKGEGWRVNTERAEGGAGRSWLEVFDWPPEDAPKSARRLKTQVRNSSLPLIPYSSWKL